MSNFIPANIIEEEYLSNKMLYIAIRAGYQDDDIAEKNYTAFA